MIFGFRDACVHEDFATAKVADTLVLEIPSQIYREIITQTQLRAAEQKVDFLRRFGPAFRTVTQETIEKFESLFVKEEATQGHYFLSQDEPNDFLFLLYKGQCARSIRTNSIVNEEALFPKSIREKQKILILDYLPLGSIFGIKASMTLSKQLNSVEVTSKKARVLKISHAVFFQNFGGWTGQPV
jgi:hypothetical protein